MIDIIFCLYTYFFIVRIYFFSETPCALKANGLLLGLLDEFERSFEAELADKIVLEAAPLDGGTPFSFLLDETLLFDPPPPVTAYVSDDFLALSLRFFSAGGVRVLRQLEAEGWLFTLFRQGELMLSAEREGQYFVRRVPDALEDAVISFDGAVTLEGSKAAAAYTTDGDERFFLFCKNHIAGDAIGRQIECSWQNGELRQKLTDESIPSDRFEFGFLENVRLGADVSALLADDLPAGAIADFLGSFDAVIPLDGGAGIVKKKKVNLYEIKAVRLERDGNKIKNILI